MPDASDRPERIVLVVDDSEHNRLILAHFLARPHWQVDEAENGLLALERVAEREYDVVILDIEMPVMDGLEVAARIRAGAMRRQPLIVGLSSHDDAETVQRALAGGCDRYLTKPVNRQALVDLVSGATGGGAVSPPTLDPDIVALLPAFLRKQQQEIEQLRTAIDAADGVLVRRISHRMRGSTALYGLSAASAVCAEIEELSRSERFREAGDRLAGLAALLKSEEDRLG